MWMFVLGVLCVKMMCCGDMWNEEIIHNGCWDNVIVEIIFFWCLLNVRVFPYVYVTIEFLTPFLIVVVFMVSIFVGYKYLGRGDLVAGHLEGCDGNYLPSNLFLWQLDMKSNASSDM